MHINSANSAQGDEIEFIFAMVLKNKARVSDFTQTGARPLELGCVGGRARTDEVRNQLEWVHVIKRKLEK